MGHVKGQPRIFHDPACVGGFGFSLGGGGHIVPASKEVELVPRTLAVAEENEISKRVAIVGEAGFRGYFHPKTNAESGHIKFSVTKVVTVPAGA